MATRMRAPGLSRAGLFVLLGVLFAAVLVTVARLAYGFSNPFDGAGGWDTRFQNAVLVVGLIAAARSTTGSTGRRAGRPVPRTTPRTARGAGRTTSGSTRTTR